jgi:hypothetical protein
MAVIPAVLSIIVATARIQTTSVRSGDGRRNDADNDGYSDSEENGCRPSVHKSPVCSAQAAMSAPVPRPAGPMNRCRPLFNGAG